MPESRDTRVLISGREKFARRKPGLERVWTFQPREVWKKLQESGTLFVDPVLTERNKKWLGYYGWMQQQMKEKVPHYGGHLPWWCYIHRKPLVHWFKYYHSQDEAVRIELQMPAERILESHYLAWDLLVKGYYVPESEDDDQRWDREVEAAGPEAYFLKGKWKRRVRQSWPRVLDIDLMLKWNNGLVQGCFEELRLSDVVEVTELRAWPRRANILK